MHTARTLASGKAMKQAHDPDVKQFASAEYRTALAHLKVIVGIHRQLGK